jgi:hypothetical protein
MLDLRFNNIGNVGVQHLANALQNNTVNLIIYSFVLYNHYIFIIDTDDFKPVWQRNRC